MGEDRAVRHLERVEWAPNRRRPPEFQAWPYAIPAVGQLIAEGGLDIDPGVTFVVVENGSGKSTLVEAFAAVYPRAGVATHSPLLVSLPEATLLEVGEWGFRRAAGFEDLDLVGEWRSYLDAPPRFLKHLLDD